MAKKDKPNHYRITDPQRDPSNLVQSLRDMARAARSDKPIQDRILKAANVKSSPLVSIYPDESED